MTRDEWRKIVDSINAAWPTGALTAAQADAYFDALNAVSYTHLTLPTIYSV